MQSSSMPRGAFLGETGPVDWPRAAARGAAARERQVEVQCGKTRQPRRREFCAHICALPHTYVHTPSAGGRRHRGGGCIQFVVSAVASCSLRQTKEGALPSLRRGSCTKGMQRGFPPQASCRRQWSRAVGGEPLELASTAGCSGEQRGVKPGLRGPLHKAERGCAGGLKYRHAAPAGTAAHRPCARVREGGLNARGAGRGGRAFADRLTHEAPARVEGRARRTDRRRLRVQLRERGRNTEGDVTHADQSWSAHKGRGRARPATLARGAKQAARSREFRERERALA